MGDEHALTARGLRQLTRAAPGEIDVDDERAAAALLEQGRGLRELLGPTTKGREAPLPRRDGVVDV